MRGENDKPPRPLEVDAKAYALLEQLAQREGLQHYGDLLRAELPKLRAKGRALAEAAEAALPPAPSPEPIAEASLSASSTATAEPTPPLVEGTPS